MALTETEQRSQAATMRVASSFGGTPQGGPTRHQQGGSGVVLQSRGPSKVGTTQAIGAGVTGLASAAVGAAVHPVLGAIVALMGGLTTSAVAQQQAAEETREQQRLDFINRKALGQARREGERAERGLIEQAQQGQAMAAPQQMQQPQQGLAPGTEERMVRGLMGGGYV